MTKNHSQSMDVDKIFIYYNFIKECESKEYDNTVVLHRHHMYPKHIHRYIDSTVKKNKIIKLSVEDHITAHLLLAECYEKDSYEYLANIHSARLLTKKSIKDVKNLKEIASAYKGKNNPFYGKKHTEKTKKILSEKTTQNLTGVNYEERYGSEKAQIEKDKRKKCSRTKEQYAESGKKASKTIKERGSLRGAKNPFSKTYIVNNMIFGCKNELIEYFKMSYYKIRKKYNVIVVDKKESVQ